MAFDDLAGDGQAQAQAFKSRAAVQARKGLKQAGLVGRVKADAIVGQGKCTLTAFFLAMQPNAGLGLWATELEGIGQQLGQRLAPQDGIGQQPRHVRGHLPINGPGLRPVSGIWPGLTPQ